MTKVTEKREIFQLPTKKKSGTDGGGTSSLDARRLDGSEKRTLLTGAEGEALYPWGFALEGDQVWLAREGKAVLLDPATGETETWADASGCGTKIVMSPERK